MSKGFSRYGVIAAEYSRCAAKIIPESSSNLAAGISHCIENI